MNATLEQIKTAVTGLSKEDQAELMEFMRRNLNGDAGDQASDEQLRKEWHDEVDRRFAEIESGEVAGHTLEEFARSLQRPHE